MKKIIANIFLLAAISLVISSCKKSFVEDIVSPTNISLEGYYTSQANFQAALTGIYGHLRNVYDGFFRLAEVPSDNTLSTPTVNADTGPLDQMTWLPTDVPVLAQWQNAYTNIAYCNNFLDQLQVFTQMDTALKSRWLGEAKFIRALNYFNLVRFFGDVPLVLKKINAEQEAYAYPRTPVSDVYAQIIRDLNDAQNVLPAQYTSSADLGRVTAGAAQSLLGKVYITTGQYAAASLLLRNVVMSNRYALLPNYADVFSTNNENNREIIFSVQYARGPARGSDLLSSVQARGLNQGTRNLFNAFETGDARKPTCINIYTVGSNTTYYTRKYIDQPPTSNEGENNWIVLRYADVVLLYAESLNETGDSTNALAQLNTVRVRAGLLPRAGLNRAAIRTQIDRDRRIELCFEGHRWFDLVRRGPANMVTAMQAQFAADGLNYTVAPFRALFPVPFREITLNASLGQNPGY
jgi:starch-binding outer membrane protein, SusD/RagB family